MNSYQTHTAGYPAPQNWWETKEPQNDYSLQQKFQQHDKNRDGLLDKNEYRSLLKDVFSTQISNQFLEDAIEETVWRTPSANFATAKQAIAGINDTLRGETQPSTTTKPFNAQGQQLPYPTTNTTSSFDFNPFNLPPPPPVSSSALPPSLDPTTLPPPPPLAPLRFSGETSALPPPPIGNMAGVGGVRKSFAPPANVSSAKPAPAMMPQTARPLPSTTSAKMPAHPSGFIAPSKEMLQEKMGTAPVRVLPMGQAKPGLNSAASASEEESRAFVEYINTNTAMQQDPDVKGYLPIKPNTPEIYTIVSDGWLLCKLLNAIQPEIIPSSQIKLRPKNAFEKIENHSLALQAARKLGCKTVNIGPEDLLQGKPRLVLGLLWQIIKRDVLSKVSLAQHPEIYKLARNTNNLKEITDSSPEEVLLRWANHHLNNATQGRMKIANFSNDVKDGTTYTLLMNQVAPQVCTTDALRETDLRKRAQMIVDNAKKLNCDRFVTAADIVNGNDKLNLAFVADLFNKHSGLELPTLEEMEKLKKQNANMSQILDEAEARLRQILADGQLAHELQQEEILLYRQRKLKEQEQLAEQEAMLRAQLNQEELMLLQQQRMKDLKLAEQESFAREEQKKEEARIAKLPRSATTGLPKDFTKAYVNNPTYSTSSSTSSSAPRTNPTPAPVNPPRPTSSTSSFSSGSSYYPSSSTPAPAPTPAPAQSYAAPAAYPPASSYNAYSAPAQSYSTPSYSAPTQSYSAPASSYPANTQSYSTSSQSSYSAPAQSYSSNNYNAYSAPQSYGTSAPSYSTSSQSYPAQSYPAPAQSYSSNNYTAPAPNPYNTSTYPPTPNYPVDNNVYSTTTTHTVHSDAPGVYPDSPDLLASPTAKRKGHLFERVGKKIDRAFH